MNKVNLTSQVELPVIIQVDEMDSRAFVSFFLKHREEIEDKLLINGAIKFQGVKIDSTAVFQEVVNAISSKFLAYIDGNSPRTKLTGTVYTSTEYDKTQRITMHNELSYSAKWPNKLFFTCLQPAETGGETLLADSREILKNMHSDIVSEIQAKGIIYIRNLHGGTGIGPSWQDTFETQDRKTLEAYCTSYGIGFEWLENGNLRLKQRSKGIIEHRKSGEQVWFNQIDQFHPCHLGEELYAAMMAIYDSPEEFPMYVRYGDGQNISEETVKEILKTIDGVTIAPVWQTNELLIVDNELVSHGRNAYTGERKVLVSMSE